MKMFNIFLKNSYILLPLSINYKIKAIVHSLWQQGIIVVHKIYSRSYVLRVKAAKENRRNRKHLLLNITEMLTHGQTMLSLAKLQL